MAENNFDQAYKLGQDEEVKEEITVSPCEKGDAVELIKDIMCSECNVIQNPRDQIHEWKEEKEFVSQGIEKDEDDTVDSNHSVEMDSDTIQNIQHTESNEDSLITQQVEKEQDTVGHGKDHVKLTFLVMKNLRESEYEGQSKENEEQSVENICTTRQFEFIKGMLDQRTCEECNNNNIADGYQPETDTSGTTSSNDSEDRKKSEDKQETLGFDMNCQTSWTKFPKVSCKEGEHSHSDDDIETVSESKSAHGDQKTLAEISELKRALTKRYSVQICLSLSSMLLLVLTILGLLYINFYEPRAPKKEDARLSHLRDEAKFWKKRYEEERGETADIVRQLQRSIEEHSSEHSFLKAKVEKLRKQIEYEEINRGPAQELKEILQIEEETLFSEVVLMRENLKSLEDSTYKTNKFLAEIAAVKEAIAKQDIEIQNSLSTADKDLEVKCNRLRVEMKKKIAKLLADMEELTQLQIPYMIKVKYQESLIDRMLLEHMSKSAIKQSAENALLRGKEELKAKLQVIQELHHIATGQAEQLEKNLSQKLENSKKGLSKNNQNDPVKVPLTKNKEATNDQAVKVVDTVTERLKNKSISDEIVKKNASLDNSKLCEIQQLQKYKIGSLGLIHPIQNIKQGRTCGNKNSIVHSDYMAMVKNKQNFPIVREEMLNILSELGLTTKLSKKYPANI